MSSKYTLLVSADLNPDASLTAIETSLKTISSKVTLDIQKITINKDAISSIKTQIEENLGTINVKTNVTGSTNTPSLSGDVGNGTSGFAGSTNLAQKITEIKSTALGGTVDVKAIETIDGITTATLKYKNALDSTITEVYKFNEETQQLEMTQRTYADSESQASNKIQSDISKETQGIKTLNSAYGDLNSVKQNIMNASTGGVGIVDQSSIENAQIAAQNYEKVVEEVKSHGSIISPEDNQKLVIAKQEMDQMNGALKEEVVNLNNIVSARLKDEAGIQKQITDSQKIIDSNNALMKNKSANNSLVQATIQADTQLAAIQKEVAAATQTTTGVTEKQAQAFKDAQINAKNAGDALRGAKGDANSWGYEINVAIKRTIEWATAMGLLYGTIRQIKEGIQFIQDLNKELVNIQIVTGATNAEAEKMANTFNDLAKATGTTTQTIAEGSSEWLCN
jgi:hypothetical protein